MKNRNKIATMTAVLAAAASGCGDTNDNSFEQRAENGSANVPFVVKATQRPAYFPLNYEIPAYDYDSNGEQSPKKGVLKLRVQKFGHEVLMSFVTSEKARVYIPSEGPDQYIVASTAPQREKELKKVGLRPYVIRLPKSRKGDYVLYNISIPGSDSSAIVKLDGRHDGTYVTATNVNDLLTK